MTSPGMARVSNDLKPQRSSDDRTGNGMDPREIHYDTHGLKMGYCERSLRAQTPMGERISIAKSETVPDGSTIEFEVECLDPKLEDMVRECLNYGRMRGIGQWRNSGKGTYLWDELDDNGNVIGGNNKKGR